MIPTVVLLLGSFLPGIEAHVLLEKPQHDHFVTQPEIDKMKNPKIRKALIKQCEYRELNKDFPLELWTEDEAGAWVLALHIARQEVRAQKEKKPKVRD